MKRPRALDERGPMLRVGSVAEDGTDRLPHRAGSDDPRRSRSAPTGMEIPIAGATEPKLGQTLGAISIVHSGAFEARSSIPVFAHGTFLLLCWWAENCLYFNTYIIYQPCWFVKCLSLPEQARPLFQPTQAIFCPLPKWAKNEVNRPFLD